MAKSNQIKKVINGEIADADDVNQIVENAGNEGGSIPYNPTSHERSDNGTQSLGSTEYPWGSLNINREAELVEVDPVSNTVASSVAIQNLRKFIYLKDVPSSYSGKSGFFPSVKSSEDGLEFVNPPVKSTVIFMWNGHLDYIQNVVGIYRGSSLTPDMSVFQDGNIFFGVYGNTNRTILRSKFIKTPGISTITIYAVVWSSTTGSNEEAILTVNVGGASNTVKSTTSTTPTWVTSTIDVSGLTNNTFYDIEISLKNEHATVNAYCSNIILTGD